MSITRTEFNSNVNKYIDISFNEDIYIIENGKTISMLSNPYKNKIAIVKSLCGCINLDITEEEVKAERLSKI